MDNKHEMFRLIAAYLFYWWNVYLYNLLLNILTIFKVTLSKPSLDFSVSFVLKYVGVIAHVHDNDYATSQQLSSSKTE